MDPHDVVEGTARSARGTTPVRRAGARSSRRSPALVGRGDELDAIMSRRRGVVVVRGGRCSGRSALLDALDARYAAAGRIVLRPPAGGPAWDHYGVAALVDAVRERFEELHGGPELAGALAGADSACTAGSYGSADGRTALLGAGAALLATPALAGAVVLLDDAGALAARPGPLAGAAGRAGHLVVAAVEDDVVTRHHELLDTADAVVDLRGLTPRESGVLLGRRSRHTLAPHVTEAIRAALGPLAGDPGALLGALGELERRGELVDVHGLRCLREGTAITLPPDHPGVAVVDALGGAARDVVVLAAADPAFGMDDLAVLAAVRDPTLDQYGEAADVLVGRGVLQDGSNGLVVRSPAVAATVVERFGASAQCRLHADMVGALRRCGGSRALAEHVAAAGTAVDADAELGELLAAEGRRAERGHPQVAVRLYRAARRHEGAGRLRGTAALRLEKLLVGLGEFEVLDALVAESARAERPTGTRRERLAALAGMAALHLGTPVRHDVRDALGSPAGAPLPLALCDRWFAGEPVTLSEAGAAFAVLRGSDEVSAPPAAEDSIAFRHLVPVFSAVLGSAYRGPAAGFAAGVDRVVRGYAGGCWDDALTAARTVLAGSAGDAPTRALVAVLAAEMSAWQGRDRVARDWLDGLGPDGPSPTVRRGIACWLADEPLDPVALVRWAHELRRHRDARGVDAGHRHLLRMAVVVLSSGSTTWRRWLLGEVRAQARDAARTVDGPAYTALLEGLLGSDADQAVAGVEALRDHAHRVDLALACLATGMVAVEPGPWLDEARTIADELGADGLGARVRRVMTGRGVAVRRGTPPAELSSTEYELIRLVRGGSTNRQIAARLRLSEKTVENHLTRLFAKVGCRSRYGLMTAAVTEPTRKETA